jgi:predicted Zn finger-like uncharacterized protein
MALATRCPHCDTTFRVAHDQLKLRAGIVRCGTCKQIFNGIEHLLPAAEVAPSFAATERVSAPAERAEGGPVSAPASDFVRSPAIDLPDPSPEFTINSLDFEIPFDPPQADEAASVIRSPYSSDPKADSAFFSTAFAKAKYHQDEQPEPDFASARIAAVSTFQQDAGHVDSSGVSDDRPAYPHNSGRNDDRSELSVSKETSDIGPAPAEEPGFIVKWQHQQRTSKMRRILFGIASVILFITLLAQGVYIFRKHITAWFPSMEPVLAQICIKMGCQVNLPAQITAVSIESSELQTSAVSKNAFALTLLLANHSQLTQAWPSIELTLNDGNEQPVARRIFMPNEYLASLPGPIKGIPANTEQPVKLFFELAQLKASGYRVYLFYS